MSESFAGGLSRWEYYVLHRGSTFAAFWNHHLAVGDRNILFVLGEGFDPRMCLGLEQLVTIAGPATWDVEIIEFDEGPESPSQEHYDLTTENRKRLEALVSGRVRMRRRAIKTRSDDRKRSIGPRRVANLFTTPGDLTNYTDVVVDVSALPQSLFFPLIAKMLYLLEDAVGKESTNLHVIVWDDVDLDSRIKEQGLDDTASYLYPFSTGDREAFASLPVVWIPLLGEGKQDQLRLIDELIQGEKEMCPVLPFPSRNARRADDMIMAYHQLLFEGLRVEPRNFIYASEHNPFEVYRQIGDVVRRFGLALRPLGGCKFVISAMSSKLFSLGALLAAIELKADGVDLALTYVGCLGYAIKGDATPRGELYGMWLSGECDAQ